MKHTTYRYTDYLGPEDAFHFARLVLPRQRPSRVHDHDYHELVWIQHGTARHFINGTVQDLSEGDLIFVRPSDRHAFQGRGEETWAVNIIIAPNVAEAIATRHPQTARRFLFPDGALPSIHRHTSRELVELSRAALRLETGRRSALRAEAFLLGVLSELTDSVPDLPDATPDWLVRACAAAASPEVFRDGAAGFVRVAGRQHAHVSRVCRDILGVTPTDYVNGIRMEHAARCLAGGSDRLEAIARECGFENLSHFHRLFKARYGMTPKAWRDRYQKSVVDPI